MGFWKNAADQLRLAQFNASFGGAYVRGHKLLYVDKSTKFGKSVDVETIGLSASIKNGAEVDSYVSKGAVGVGAGAGLILFGPIGAVAGGLIGSAKRKGGGMIYVVIEQDGKVIGTIPGEAKKEKEAFAFVNALNASAADMAERADSK